ncbi:MAG: two-component sensor histidine kinase, partial [Beijerinckiaceae bacterium]|nr:two-component sensor histidine kinase [Beijerinckiaceae bacterium]
IGLALARWVTERHDGTIGLGTGADGRGACVTLVLPVLDLVSGDQDETKRKEGVA